jgi:hypothetical protein
VAKNYSGKINRGNLICYYLGFWGWIAKRQKVEKEWALNFFGEDGI